MNLDQLTAALDLMKGPTNERHLIPAGGWQVNEAAQEKAARELHQQRNKERARRIDEMSDRNAGKHVTPNQFEPLAQKWQRGEGGTHIERMTEFWETWAMVVRK